MNPFVILVVEDEQPLLEAITFKLEQYGIQAVSARSTAQALEYLAELPKVDAIWLDHYLLGEEDGLDLVAEVKNPDSFWKNIPIFVVSNTASNEKVTAYLHFGVERYFVKSNYRLDQIIENIKDTLAYATND